MRAAVEAAWERVVDGWDDATRHDAFMGLVAQYGEFAWAAKKYKERAGDPVADKQLEKLGKAAIATMFASSTKKERQSTPYKASIIIFCVLLFMLILGLVGLKMVHDTSPKRPARPPITQPARH